MSHYKITFAPNSIFRPPILPKVDMTESLRILAR